MDRLHAADHEERVRILQESDHPAARQLRTEARERERKRIREIWDVREMVSEPQADYLASRAFDDDAPDAGQLMRELVDRQPGGGPDNG